MDINVSSHCALVCAFLHLEKDKLGSRFKNGTYLSCYSCALAPQLCAPLKFNPLMPNRYTSVPMF